jgi:tRNA-splicing ligase RtcB
MPEIRFEKIDDYRFRIPKNYKPGMRVDGIIYATKELLAGAEKDNAFEQVANVAFLPGIVKYSLAMPDIHWGYGFPIGGVAATDPENGGVISPGGVGYDINCGVRLLKTNLNIGDVRNKISAIVNRIYQDVPSGVGSTGEVRVSVKEERKVLLDGAKWAVARGYGVKEDLDVCEEYGAIDGADPDTRFRTRLHTGKEQTRNIGQRKSFS